MKETMYFKKAEKEISNRPCYTVMNKTPWGMLGEISWYPPWKKFVCSFPYEAIWSESRMKEVLYFLEKLNNE